MTFGRALVIAGMAAFFTECDDLASVFLVIFSGLFCWQFTSDPISDAVRDGLRRFEREWRRR